MPDNKINISPERPPGAQAFASRRRMWLALCAIVLAAAAGLFLTARHVLNERFISDYGAGKYTDTFEKLLLPVNLPEGWLPLYHMGNISYQKEDYDAAISWYQQSLEKNPPAEEKECAVRINLALALLHKIDYEHLDTEKAVSTAITQLRTARSVLTEHGCADPDGTDGHSPEAEQLKKEIDELLRQLQNQSSDQQEEEDDQQEQEQQENQDQQDDRKESNREKQIREELEQQRQQSAQKRAEAESERDRQGQEGSSDWFDGKTW